MCLQKLQQMAVKCTVYNVYQSLPQTIIIAVSYGMLEDWKDEMTGVEVSDEGNAEDAK